VKLIKRDASLGSFLVNRYYYYYSHSHIW